MKYTVKIKSEVEVCYLQVMANARYWGDSEVNGVEDKDGTLIPLRKGDCWCPVINVDTGQILDWPQGTTASIHYKVCDQGVYKLIDANNDVIVEKEGYVPACMSPKESGYGDYIIMDINEIGIISNWSFNAEEFEEAED